MRKFKNILLVLLLVCSVGNAQLFNNRMFIETEISAEIGAPVYKDNGGLVAVSGISSIDVPYPTTVNENNILFAIIGWDVQITISTPSEWSLVQKQEDLATMGYALFWKRADGTETGTETFTLSGAGTPICGIISRFSGAVETGTPFGTLDIVAIGARNNTFYNSQFSPLISSLGLGFFWQDDNQVWTIQSIEYEQAFNLSTTAGSDFTLALQHLEITPETPNPGSVTYLTGGFENTSAVGLLLIGKE